MKNVVNIAILITILSVFHLESKPKKRETSQTCCPGVKWTTPEECREDAGDYIQSDKCCNKTFLGKKDSDDQICCGSCTEDVIDPGVD